MPGKVYFITGANRGIGFELIKALTSDPSNTILASAWDPTKATALNELAAVNGNIHIIKLDVSSESSISSLDSQLYEFASDGIDYFISNAGIAHDEAFTSSLEVAGGVWMDHFKTNTLGPVLVSQKVVPFLKKKDTKVIYFVSTKLASISEFLPVRSSAYGTCKAALDYFVKLLAFELKKEKFIVVAVSPGLVSTDLLTGFLNSTSTPGVPSPFQRMVISPGESAKRQVELLHKLTRDDTGKFFNYTGEETVW